MIGRPMMRRGPGLLGMAARTAVVAGTATAVSGGMRRHQAERAQEQEMVAEAQMQQQAAAAQAQTQTAQRQARQPAAAGGISEEAMAKLTQLAELQKQGILTPEEFASQKAKLLGM